MQISISAPQTGALTGLRYAPSEKPFKIGAFHIYRFRSRTATWGMDGAPVSIDRGRMKRRWVSGIDNHRHEGFGHEGFGRDGFGRYITSAAASIVLSLAGAPQLASALQPSLRFRTTNEEILKGEWPFASVERTAATTAIDFTVLRSVGLYLDDLVVSTTGWTVELYWRSLHWLHHFAYVRYRLWCVGYPT